MDDDDPALIKKKFWSFYKSTSNSCRIPETVSYHGKFKSENKDIANLFNTFFSDQFSTASEYNIEISFEDDTLIDFEFDIDKISGLLRNLNANKAAGPDGLQAKLLKGCARGLAKPLSILYNKCFKLGKLPDKWKLANVVPVFNVQDKVKQKCG